MKNKKYKIILLSLLVMACWGSIFPMIKIGYRAFRIDTSAIPDIMMFAALRFIISGLIVCVIALIKKEKLQSRNRQEILCL